MDNPPFIKVPTWKDGQWVSRTVFDTREDFIAFLLPLFKEPGKYELDKTVPFNEQSQKFNKDKFYCDAPEGSKKFKDYWDTERRKCRRGAIFIKGDKTWYLPRDYYMWINFLHVYNKEVKKFGFVDIRDGQLHTALYELLAELHYKHSVITKKRQFAISYYHMAKFVNQIWFEEGCVLKIGASLMAHINNTSTWKYLEEYRSFLNKNTAWYRDFNPGGEGKWVQQVESTESDGKKSQAGYKGSVIALSFENSNTKGVGGPTTYFFYEEAGMAPKMDITFEFLRPAMQSGLITTGMFIASGSVGELTECEPLKEFLLNPDKNGMYAVEHNLMDEEGTHGRTGLFIPEQWSMPPCIDEHGNSLIDDALKRIDEVRAIWKAELVPSIYRLRISQHPKNIKEAFDFREESLFPLHLVLAQEARIKDKQYPIEYVDLRREADNTIKITPSTKLPIMDFPVKKTIDDKTGVIVMYERPRKDPQFGDYYASVDPVSEGKAEYINNNLYTPYGRKKIGNIKVGDLIIGSDGLSTKVTGLFPQGVKKLYRITFSDRHSILVCENHLWNVMLNGGTKGFITLSVADLLNPIKKITYKGIGRNKDKDYTINTFFKDNQGRNKWFIPILKGPIIFAKRYNIKLPIDPYLLGLLIGDGGMSSRALIFSSIDKELIYSIEKLLDSDIQIKKKSGNNCDYSITTKIGTRNSLTKKLRDLKLHGKKSEGKFIPKMYKYSSVQKRLALLQGLMDTDGSCTNHGAEFYSSSKQLAYDVVDLVQTLGGVAKIRMKKTTHLDSYIVRVNLPKGLYPFRLSRKKNLYKPSTTFCRYITDITYEREDEAICISVDAPDQLYVTEHAIVTHNTSTSDSLCSIYIYKTAIEIRRETQDGQEVTIERDGIVASWCGRFDDINKTHERLCLMIEIYNAWAVVENNISQFILYMRDQNKHRYLVPKSQVAFLKEISANSNVFQEYGWRNTGTMFRSHLLSYLIEWLKEEIDVETKPDGEIVKITYGIERLPDIMALREMIAYTSKLNVDRLVALSALIGFVKVRELYRPPRVIIESSDSKGLDKSKKITKLESTMFRHVGQNNHGPNKVVKSAFKNIR